MRTTTKERRWIIVLAVALVPMAILITGKPLMADKLELSISNDFEREETLLPGVESVIDTFSQDYRLNWSETYSSRLNLGVDFELEMEDTIRSLDVDEKTVTPSFEISATGLIWDLSYFVQDNIIYTNEFNTARRDEIEYNLDISLEPFYFPPVSATVQRLTDLQPNLEDKIEDKFDISTDYELLELLSIDLQWKQEETDDRFVDNSDSRSHDWKVQLSSNQLVTSSVKLDLQTSLEGSREETLNNAGTVLNLEQGKTFNGRIKLTLDTFPNFTSSLEFERTEEFVDDEVENSINLSAEYTNPIVDLGDLTETVDITKTGISGPGEETDQLTTGLGIKLEGAPGRYLDYSIEYSLDFDSLKDDLDSANDKKTQDDEFNLSFILTVREGISLENSFNWSAARENGVRSGSSKGLKINGVFEGEYLDVPNLVFTPALSYENDKDFIASEVSDTLSLALGFLYTFVLPPNSDWSVDAKYDWEDSSGEQSSSMTITSDFQYELSGFPWEFKFEESSDADFDFSGDEETVWKHEFQVTLARELTPTIFFDTDYEYKYDGDGNNSDKVESHLEWGYRSAGLAFGITNDRVFESGLDVTRTYTVEFFMDF